MKFSAALLDTLSLMVERAVFPPMIKGFDPKCETYFPKSFRMLYPWI
jgi:hypothetical protein